MWTLTLRTPDEKPSVFQVNKTRLTIGRREDNDIVLAEQMASRVHAELTYDSRGELLTLRDLGSTNGTYVNRERILEPHPLKHDDVIRIGGDTIEVTYFITSEPLGMRILGTQPLTREMLLESIDQYAVLLYEVSRRLNTVMDLETALGEVSELMQVTMGAAKCELILAEDFDQLTERGFPTTFAAHGNQPALGGDYPQRGGPGGKIREECFPATGALGAVRAGDRRRRSDRPDLHV